MSANSSSRVKVKCCRRNGGGLQEWSVWDNVCITNPVFLFVAATISYFIVSHVCQLLVEYYSLFSLEEVH